MKTKLQEFQTADWDKQSRLLEDPKVLESLTKWLGSEVVKEIANYGSSEDDLAAGDRGLIVVPGVMGSSLQSSGEGGIWWLDLVRAKDKLNALELAPGGNDDADPAVGILPCAIDITYGPFRRAITQSGTFGGTKQLPYDWRKPLSNSAAGLKALIDSTFATSGKRVHLVGHSMGGLLIRATLMIYGDELWSKVGKIVFIGTPHYGSPSIASYLKNHLWGWEKLAILGAFLSRRTFRSFYGVMNLLPAPQGIYPGTRNGEPHPCSNFDLYNAAAYKIELERAEYDQLQQVLEAAKKMHADLYQWHQKIVTGDQKRQMLQICGVGYQTLFRLEVDANWTGVWRDVDRVLDRVVGEPDREGDGRVPLSSAQLEGVECRYIKGVHGSLHNVPGVADDVIAWISDRALQLSRTPGGALANTLSADRSDPTPHLSSSADVSNHGEKYNRYCDFTALEVRKLVDAFEAGGFPDIDLVRIL